MSHSALTGTLHAHELCTGSCESSEETTGHAGITARKSARVTILRAKAFCRMNTEEQRSFIALRFQELDIQDLVTIVRAVYGRPADKGRPRTEG